ncbi:MAG: hypothetical protein RR367_02510, partial [Clostridia bacterium]
HHCSDTQNVFSQFWAWQTFVNGFSGFLALLYSGISLYFSLKLMSVVPKQEFCVILMRIKRLAV